MTQLDLPLAHEYVVEILRPVRVKIAATSATQALELVVAAIRDPRDSYEIKSVVRIDLLDDLVRDPVKLPVKPRKGKPPGKPSPSGGSPGTPRVDKPIITDAIQKIA